MRLESILERLGLNQIVQVSYTTGIKVRLLDRVPFVLGGWRRRQGDDDLGWRRQGNGDLGWRRQGNGDLGPRWARRLRQRL